MNLMNEDSRISRIKKLLTLAGEGNPSREEAELAMAKAHQLMLQHDLALADLKEKAEPDEFSKHFVGTPYNRRPPEQEFISRLLQAHFHVKVLYSNIHMRPGKVPTTITPVRRQGPGDDHPKRYLKFSKVPEYAGMTEGDWGMQLIGRKSNILIAEYVYDFLSLEFGRLWKQHREETGKGAYAKLDFYQGLYEGLNQRLHDERRRHERAVTSEQREELAIVKVNDDEALRKYVNEEFSYINHARGSYRESRDVDSYAEGKAAGQRLNIRPAVNQGRGIKSLPARSTS